MLQSDWTANILLRGTNVGIGLTPDLSCALRSGYAPLIIAIIPDGAASVTLSRCDL